jgi:hypothetical protein
VVSPPDANCERVFPWVKDPRELVLLRAGSHTGFAQLASLLDQTMNLDRIACSVLSSVTVVNAALLGTADEGIVQDPSVCPPFCQGTPVVPSLDADRQQLLTRAVALAFFDAQLKKSGDAQRFVQGTLASENAEVTIQLR